MSIAEIWGTTADEVDKAYPCDGLVGRDFAALYRSVSVQARPATVYRWLCQLRKAPYSYDWLDNFGRKSPEKLSPGLDELAVGQRVMTIFRIVSFEPGVHLTIELAPPLSRLAPAWISYFVTESATGCRLTAKIVSPRPKTRAERALFRGVAWLDLPMMRKQLLTLKKLAESQERKQARNNG